MGISDKLKLLKIWKIACPWFRLLTNYVWSSEVIYLELWNNVISRTDCTTIKVTTVK